MTLKVIVFKETAQNGKWLVAQCLDYDIAVQAPTMRELPNELNKFFTCYLAACKKHDIEPFKNLSKAPKKYWDWFESSLALSQEEANVELPEIPPPHVIQKSEMRVHL